MGNRRVDTALAEEDLGVEHGFELLLHQPRLGGTFPAVVAEEARESLGAVTVTSPCAIELVGLIYAKRRGTGDGKGRVGRSFRVAFGYLFLQARRQIVFVKAPNSVGVVDHRKIRPAAAVLVGSNYERASDVGREGTSVECNGELRRRGKRVCPGECKNGFLLMLV